MSVEDALRAELSVAIRGRDQPVVAALRSALAALANAEAVAPGDLSEAVVQSPHFAGSTPGLGAAEAPRRILSDEQKRSILAAEELELNAHADQLSRVGRDEQATGARRAAQVLRTVMAD